MVRFRRCNSGKMSFASRLNVPQTGYCFLTMEPSSWSDLGFKFTILPDSVIFRLKGRSSSSSSVSVGSSLASASLPVNPPFRGTLH